jgi:hypothetical protein
MQDRRLNPPEKARVFAGFFFALLAAMLSGCIVMPQAEALREAGYPGLPRKVELTEVPFFPQAPGDNLCGPNSLAMVLGAAGINPGLSTLTEQVYLPGREGSLQVEMMAAVRRNGLLAVPLAPEVAAIMKEVADGRPVLVLQNLMLQSFFPQYHYAVIVGFDTETREFLMHSGSERSKRESIAVFELTWLQPAYWGMLAVKPGQVPITARENDYAGAVAAFERAGFKREARESYLAALARWPSNLIALVGLGNMEYELGDKAAAERAFRRATEAHPQNAAAWNNFAYVLAELGKLEEAETAARQAVALGGPSADNSRSTLDQILKKRAAR